jgi:exopolyphosphatase / guanosine-5'-triphosphate,3'-diphosphate pyrophosphatase
MEKKKAITANKIVAVVDIGSTAIRIVIAEIDSEGDWKRLDRAAKPVPLGRDVFMSGHLSRETMLQAIKVLSGFLEMLSGWHIGPRDVRVIATSAIREAKNRDTFVDRVYIRTGLRINIIEGVEENHLTYLAVQHAVDDMPGPFTRSSSLIIEVGGGTTEVMLLDRGNMVAAHSFRIGTVRIEQQVRPRWESNKQMEDYLRENLRGTLEILNTELRLSRIHYFVAVGGDARLAAANAGKKEAEHYWLIEKSGFCAFLTEMQGLSIDEIVTRLRVTYNEAEGLVPALVIYKLFLEATGAEKLIVPDVSIREGMLVSFALGTTRDVKAELYRQVITSAKSLGRKYHYDEKHAVQVSKLALSFFDQFQNDHGLEHHARLLMEVAAILHDIGNFVRSSGHHKHGQYLVANSEIFGLSREDIRIISNVIRYHRKSMPLASHTSFVSLRQEQRLIVLKLASMLRVADGLDRSHQQRVESFRLEVEEGDLLVDCTHQGDISVERYGMVLKAQMFEEVFGYHVVIT